MSARQRAWQVASALFVVLALAAVAESLRYGFLDRLGPGPGFFPFCVSVVMGALGVTLLVGSSRMKAAAADGESVVPAGDEARRVVRVAAGLVVTVVLLGPVGFRLSTLVFLVYLPWSLGARNLWAIAVIALAGSFGVFHVFHYWLHVPLPVGVFGL